MNKAQKLVKMLELMSRTGGVRATELAERFDLDARTLRRYLADLREIHIPINDEDRGEDRALSVDPQWRRTGVQLTLGEILSLHFGRKLFTFLDGTQFEEGLDNAIERLQPTISRHQADLVNRLETKFLAVPEPAKAYGGEASEILDDLISALLYDNPIEARYRKPSGVEGKYELRPYTLGTFRQGLYLFAWDVEAQQVKTFAVERFTEVLRRRKERFDPPANWRPEAHIANAFGIISGTPEEVVIAFSEQVTGYITERVWHDTQHAGVLPDGRTTLTMMVAPTVELETWILGFGDDAEVIAPVSLREKIRDRLVRAAAAYA